MSNSDAMAGTDRDPRDRVSAAAPTAARFARSAAVVCSGRCSERGKAAVFAG